LAEWATNEKVALETAYGASKAGARALAAMKHVGVNVAADPLFTAAYTGVNGGLVLITADEPGHHSSQNEQDNRNYAKFAKIPMFEPSNSQEAKDMLIEAYEISEKHNTPVLFRITTRVCHAKSIVECKDRAEAGIKDYTKDIKQNVPVPAFVKGMRVAVEERTKELLEYANTSPLNKIEWNDTKVGVIVSGAPYHFAREVFCDEVSYLKLGFTYPLPIEKIKEFASKVKKLYIIEENDPYIEDMVRILGFDCYGKNLFPYTGEMTPDVIRRVVNGETFPVIDYDKDKVVARPPTLCAGCPHRGFMHELGKRKKLMMVGDIGCYALAFAEPYNAMDDEFINNIHKASPLHDIGKVGIPDHILLKAGKLTEEEFAIMKTHVNIGYDTLKEVQNRFPNNSFLSMGLDIISCHHEKWDGSGYPYGLSGTDIALSGRIMAIADVYDALRSKRVYKDAFTHEVSCQIIKEKRGNHLDPYLVDIFIENHRKVEELDYELE
jgi:hypothetical protein